jgi:hypothetical protein
LLLYHIHFFSQVRRASLTRSHSLPLNRSILLAASISWPKSDSIDEDDQLLADSSETCSPLIDINLSFIPVSRKKKTLEISLLFLFTGNALAVTANDTS